MTKQEILALINAKIAGQGTNIDAGSALPEILSGILDLIPPTHTLTVPGHAESGDITIDEALALLKVDGHTPTFDELVKITTNWKVRTTDGYELPISFLRTTSSFVYVIFGGYTRGSGEGGGGYISISTDEGCSVYVSII